MLEEFVQVKSVAIALPRYTSSGIANEPITKNDEERVSSELLNREINEYWRYFSQVEWSSIDPSIVRDSPFSKSIFTPTVFWFIFSKMYFSKMQLFVNTDNVFEEVFRSPEERSQKEYGKFLGLLMELCEKDPRSRYNDFLGGGSAFVS
jgi:hypothetical protein